MLLHLMFRTFQNKLITFLNNYSEIKYVMLQDTYFKQTYEFYMYFFISNMLSLYFKIRILKCTPVPFEGFELVISKHKHYYVYF